ncbi:hypothetical protein UT300005_21120 [Clostridium sp. CTA-5]
MKTLDIPRIYMLLFRSRQQYNLIDNIMNVIYILSMGCFFKRFVTVF